MTLVLALAGCDGGGWSPPEDLPKIGFLGAAAADPVWPALADGARRFDERLGLVDVEYAAPIAPSPNDQARRIDAWIDAGFQGICVQVTDEAALLAPFHRARSRGIQVVTMMRDLPESGRIGFAGVDEESVGRALAEAVQAVVQDGESIMVLHAGERDAIQAARLRAYDRAAAGLGRIRTDGRFDCLNDAGRAVAIIADKMERFRPRAWVAMDDWALPAMRSGALPMPDACTMVAPGADPDHWLLLEDGRCAALVGAEDYRLIGEAALRMCAAAILNEQVVEQSFLAPAVIIRRDNLDAYRKNWPQP